MQHLADLQADALSRVSVPPCLAAACRTHVPCASSIRLAVWAADDVMAVTGNLAAEGDLALQLLPGSSAAGVTAASGSPRLADGHAAHSRTHGDQSQCRGKCCCTLYVPIGGQAAAKGKPAPLHAGGCLLVGFHCAQTDSIHRSVQLLAALASALAEVLPGAAAPLRENLSAVLAAEPQAVSIRPAAARQDERSDMANSKTGRSSHAAAPSNEDFPIMFAKGDGFGFDADSGSGLDSGSDSGSDCGHSIDSVGAVAGESDSELQPFLELNFCAGQTPVDGSNSRADEPAAAPPSPLTPSLPAGTGARAPSQGAEVPGPGPDSPRYCAGASASEFSSDSSEAGGDDSGDHHSGDSGDCHGDEAIAALKASLHDSAVQPATAPAEAQLTDANEEEAAFLLWHAASSYKMDVAALALLLLNVLSKGARPPAWLFWTLPTPSLTFAAVNAACLALALLSPWWCKQREAAMLALWAALVFISVSYALQAPTLEYSEPGALTKPLWAARAFALETTMIGPVAMRVPVPSDHVPVAPPPEPQLMAGSSGPAVVFCAQLRSCVATPVVLLHCVCAAATAPRVCAASAFTAVPQSACIAAAWTLQAKFCLALPLVLCWWLDARSRRQFQLQAHPAATAAVGTG